MEQFSAKKYHELLFTDDFMFCKILENNKDICSDLLELILGKKIRKINYLSKQKVIDITSDGKGVRLDVYLEDDENTVFDIEMQTVISKNLPKRTRYYQGMIDLNLIEKGADYKSLKKCFIIFLCIQNPFKDKKRNLYTFENRCLEDLEISLGDESTKIILTPQGDSAGISKELSEFLKYLSGNGANSEFTKRLDTAVQKAKKKEEWRLEYMTLLMRDQENFEKGLEQGRIDSLRRMIIEGIPVSTIRRMGYSDEEILKATEQSGRE